MLQASFSGLREQRDDWLGLGLDLLSRTFPSLLSWLNSLRKHTFHFASV